MIKSIDYSQHEILKNIISLHLDGNDIQCDPCYSKGNFYKNGINTPVFKSDILGGDDVLQADCRNLWMIENDTINSLMYDPPFLASKGKSLNNVKKGTNIITNRFGCFSNMEELWNFYKESLIEFNRVIKKGGKLIVKCQPVISGGKQYMSHAFIINEAQKLGFYCKDEFIQLAKNRLISGKWKKQHHARKYHCYWLVFEKKK